MQANKTKAQLRVYFFAFDLYSNLPTTSAPPPLCLVCCSEATPSVRELQELEMPEAPQPSLSSYLSLDLLLPPEAGLRFPPTPRPSLWSWSARLQGVRGATLVFDLRPC